jgi:putative inorganic carbon (hco3(-)) transporter
MMSKELLLWLVVYFGGLALAVLHPIYPLVSYLVFYYAPPHVNWWGRYIPELRWSLIASIAMLGSIVLKSSSLEPLKKMRNPALPWMIFFAFNLVVVTAWALNRARSWYWTVALLKMLFLAVLLPATIRTPAQFDMFAATHIVGASYWGYKAWDAPHRQKGRLDAVGGPDTQNDNQAAGHLLTVLPFLAVYFLSIKRPLYRAGLVVAGGLIVNVFILCNSRGATLALLVMCCAAVVLVGKGRRIKLIGVAAGGLVCLLMLADGRFISRQQTTTHPTDGSSQGRLEAWAAGLKVIRDYPLGGGGRAFHILSPKYIPDIVDEHQGEERSVHNTYLQLGCEWGLQGVFLWSGIMGSTFLMLVKSCKKSRDNPWFFYRFFAVELALIGRLVAGVFTSALYGESLYWMVGLAFALYRMHATAEAQEFAPATVPETVMPAPIGAPGAVARTVS